MLGLTSFTYQPTTKSSNRSGYPKKHLIFAMPERKPPYPAHALDMHEDEDEDDKPLVRATTTKEPLEEGRDQTIDDEDLAPLVPPIPPETEQRQKNRPPVWQDPGAYTGTTGVKGFARARSRNLKFRAKSQKVKHSETLSTSCLTSVIRRTFT